MLRFLFCAFAAMFAVVLSIAAPTKITVLPFTNIDGDIDRNIVAYDLQESIYALIEAMEDDSFELVPLEEVEFELSGLNLDPSNPQYESDLWKAVNNLGVKKVLLGSYDYDNGKYLVNAYVYDSRMKLPHPRFQSKDNFVDEDKVTTLSDKIVNDLKGAISKKK
jgi:TolB-like protein